MKNAIVVLIMLLASLPAFAGDANDKWFKVQSPNFVVYTDGSEEQARHIAFHFEEMHEIFQTLFPKIIADSTTPFVVIATKNNRSMQSLEPTSLISKGTLGWAGTFMNGEDKNYSLIRLDARRDYFDFSIDYYEYTQFLLHKDDWMPFWLSAGLSTFYESTQIAGNTVRFGEAYPNLIHNLQIDSPIPLGTLLGMNSQTPSYNKAVKVGIFHAESWALTHYLIFNDGMNKTEHLKKYIDLLSHGEDPVAAGKDAFGNLKELQKSLYKYIDENTFRTFKINIAIKFDEKSLKSYPVSLAEIESIRGDVLVRNGRLKEAQPLLEAALRDDPNNLLANEAMGMLVVLQCKCDEAAKWFGKAIDLGSENFVVLVGYGASALQNENTNNKDMDVKIETSLRKAIHINPGFAYSYDALALFYSKHNIKLDEAHILELQAIEINPQEVMFWLDNAQILVQQDRYKDAINGLKLGLEKVIEEKGKACIQIKLDEYQAALDKKGNPASKEAQIK